MCLAFLMGSVSEGVLHHAHCPVLIVRGRPHTAASAGVAAYSTGFGWVGRRSVRPPLLPFQIAQKFAAPLSVLNVVDASSLSSRLSPYVSADDAELRLPALSNFLAKITRDVSADAIAGRRFPLLSSGNGNSGGHHCRLCQSYRRQPDSHRFPGDGHIQITAARQRVQSCCSLFAPLGAGNALTIH